MKAFMQTVYTTHPRYTEHDLPGHPEHAGRIRAVWQRLEETDLVSHLQVLTPEPVPVDLIHTVHTQDYTNILQRISTSNQRHVRLDADTYATPTSYEIARLSAGGVVSAVDAVLSGKAANGLAAVRPPGHHAMPNHGMGFCLLGNIAIAARHAQHAYGLKRVMIVDFDVHHGNGTQAMFYDDPSVLFISTHQSPFYPGTGTLRENGMGAGTGYNINIPLSAGHGDESYAIIFEDIIWPAAERFQPQLILASAGFDAHWNDPLAGMRLSLTGYAHITHQLAQMAQAFCEGRIVFVMEGGYNLDILSRGMENVAHALLDDGIIEDPFGKVQGHGTQEVKTVLAQVKKLHNL